jgi:hypothetical protein
VIAPGTLVTDATRTRGDPQRVLWHTPYPNRDRTSWDRTLIDAHFIGVVITVERASRRGLGLVDYVLIVTGQGTGWINSDFIKGIAP